MSSALYKFFPKSVCYFLNFQVEIVCLFLMHIKAPRIVPGTQMALSK